jgi:hypothetical protein
MLLFPAFLVPFALRWYWARFNGAGFAAGVGTGFLAAVAFHFLKPVGWNEAQQFLAIAACSLAGSLAATLATAPVPADTLQAFYAKVAPFGWWPRAWRESHRQEHRRDLVRLAVALVWQVLTFLLPMGLVLGLWPAVLPAAAVWLVLSFLLIRDVQKAATASA